MKSTTEPLTRQDFQEIPCDCCGTTCQSPIDLTPKCHPKAGMRAKYRKKDGTLGLYCVKCRTLIATVLVDSGTFSTSFAA